MLSDTDYSESCLQWVIFMNEAVFHFSGRISCYNCRIWGLQQPNKFFEYICDTLKVNIWPRLLHDHVVGHFFFVDCGHLPTFVRTVLFSPKLMILKEKM
jgi:hypothetical protein